MCYIKHACTCLTIYLETQRILFIKYTWLTRCCGLLMVPKFLAFINITHCMSELSLKKMHALDVKSVSAPCPTYMCSDIILASFGREHSLCAAGMGHWRTDPGGQDGGKLHLWSSCELLAELCDTHKHFQCCLLSYFEDLIRKHLSSCAYDRWQWSVSCCLIHGVVIYHTRMDFFSHTNELWKLIKLM